VRISESLRSCVWGAGSWIRDTHVCFSSLGFVQSIYSSPLIYSLLALFFSSALLLSSLELSDTEVYES